MGRKFAKSSSQLISGSMPAITGGMTIAFQYRHTTTPGSAYPNRHTFVTRQDSTASIFNYVLQASSTTITLTWTSSNASYRTLNASFTADTSWHGLALSHTFGATSDSRLYIDGAAITITSNAAFTTQTTGTLGGIGSRRDSFPEYLDGEMAEVAVYDAALSAESLVALSKGFAPPRVAISNLKLYCPLVRDICDLVGNSALTNTGTTVSDHPRVYA